MRTRSVSECIVQSAKCILFKRSAFGGWIMHSLTLRVLGFQTIGFATNSPPRHFFK